MKFQSPMFKNDPMKTLMDCHGYDCEKIERVITGNKYVAVLLKTGNIGIAANLHHITKIHHDDISIVDIGSNAFRTLYVAYINAMVNYPGDDFLDLDFFNCVDFTIYQNVVMIGYSEPLVSKFSQISRIPSIFDLEKNHPLIIEQSQLPAYLRSCDCLIITATTLVNNTFGDIMREIPSRCDSYMIGPTSPMDASVFFKYNIKAIFGMQFKNDDPELLDMIEFGEGTDKFKKIGKKKAIIRQ